MCVLCIDNITAFHCKLFFSQRFAPCLQLELAFSVIVHQKTNVLVRKRLKNDHISSWNLIIWFITGAPLLHKALVIVLLQTISCSHKSKPAKGQGLISVANSPDAELPIRYFISGSYWKKSWPCLCSPALDRSFLVLYFWAALSSEKPRSSSCLETVVPLSLKGPFKYLQYNYNHLHRLLSLTVY